MCMNVSVCLRNPGNYVSYIKLESHKNEKKKQTHNQNKQTKNQKS